MKPVVVDTDAFSAIWQGTSDHLIERLVGSVPVLSFATVAELHFGAAKSGWGERRMLALEAALRRYVVAPYDQELARLWGRLKAQAQAAGHPLGQRRRPTTCGSALRRSITTLHC